MNLEKVAMNDSGIESLECETIENEKKSSKKKKKHKKKKNVIMILRILKNKNKVRK